MFLTVFDEMDRQEMPRFVIEYRKCCSESE